MSDRPESELRKAFVETGLLVGGGFAGGGLSYWLLGDNWLLNGLFTVLGAGLVSGAARRLREARSIKE